MQAVHSVLYDFNVALKKGFGARLFDILNCLVYCKVNHLDFTLLENQDINYYGYKWSEVFDYPCKKLMDDNVGLEYCKWPNLTESCPAFGTPSDAYTIDQYSDAMQRLWISMRSDIKNLVDSWVQQSGFLDTDWLMHIRWSDKVNSAINGQTFIESGPQDLSWYWGDLAQYWKSKNRPDIRLFLCTDSEEVLLTLPNPHPFTIAFDSNEIRSGNYCPKAFANELTKDQQQMELLSTLKILRMMERCSCLFGARCSYLFRIGELLHYPKFTLNIKDNDMFGAAEYDLGTPMKRPQKYRVFVNLINPDIDVKQCKAQLLEQGVISISNIFRPELAELIYQELLKIPVHATFQHSIFHQVSKTVKNIPYENTAERELELKQARECQELGQFSYAFGKLTANEHSERCMCILCRLNDSMKSFECLQFFSQISGLDLTGIGETFLSAYQKDDFLAVHHDKNKGKAAFSFSFNKNWNVANGGILHFVQDWTLPTQHIYKSCIPSFNCVNFFILDPLDKPYKNHFVSPVTGNRPRLAFTGWFS